MSVDEDDGASEDVIEGEILEGDALGLFEDGTAVGTSVTGYVGSEESKNDGLLLGDRDGVLVYY